MVCVGDAGVTRQCSARENPEVLAHESAEHAGRTQEGTDAQGTALCRTPSGMSADL